MKSVQIIILVIAISGCATTKQDYIFDGSSPESTSEGVSKVMKKLKGQKKADFLIALMRIQFSDVNSAIEVVGNPSLMSTNYENIGKKIDGLNYYQVLELASKSQTKASILSQ